MTTLVPHRRLRSGGSLIPVLIILGIVVLLGMAALYVQTARPASAAADGATSVWMHSVDDGFLAADRSGKNVLVFFTADWCPPCQMMKKDVLSRDDVIAALQRDYELVKIDLTERGGPNAMVAHEHGVQGIPAFRAYRASGVHIGSNGGVASAEQFVGWARTTAR